MDMRKIKAIEAKNKKRILEQCPDASERSGIYFLIRFDGKFKYAYIGQAKHILSRLAQHLSGYQHIDLSIKKHGLFSQSNQEGWRIHCMEVPEDKLDEAEQSFIEKYANAGYQLRNKTSGGQGEGKRGLDDSKSPRGYYDGVRQGYKNAQRFVANLFDKHLNYSQKSDKPNKNQEKAMEKFKEFLRGEDGKI